MAKTMKRYSIFGLRLNEKTKELIDETDIYLTYLELMKRYMWLYSYIIIEDNKTKASNTFYLDF